MITRDKHGNVWDWRLVIHWSWRVLRYRLWEHDGFLDGGSHYWRFGPIELQRNIRHDL